MYTKTFIENMVVVGVFMIDEVGNRIVFCKPDIHIEYDEPVDIQNCTEEEWKIVETKAHSIV